MIIMKKKKPDFKRQCWYKYKKLKKKWVKPRGVDSKLRARKKSRGKAPSVGYRAPRATRGLNRAMMEEARVSNAREVEKIDPKKQMLVIAGTVGRKKRAEILKGAAEKGIKVKNA